MLIVKVKYSDFIFYKFVPEPHFTPDSNRETIFLKISNVMKSCDFPVVEKWIEADNNNNPFFFQFNMAISVDKENEYYEYCKKTGTAFVNMMNLLYYKKETSRDFVELFSPFVSGIYDEIKKTIDSYNPTYIFPEFNNSDHYNLLRENVLSGKYLVLPYFELSESE
jgi:hypothetical protein